MVIIRRIAYTLWLLMTDSEYRKGAKAAFVEGWRNG